MHFSIYGAPFQLTMMIETRGQEESKLTRVCSGRDLSVTKFYIDKTDVFLICYINQEDSSQKPFDFAQGRESFDFTQDHELVEWRDEWSTSRKK